MDGLTKLKDQLEYLFSRVLISAMKSNTLTIPEAKQLAREFLAIEPFNSIDEAYTKVNGFVEKYPQFSLLKEYTDVYYDEDKIEQKLELMRQHLKANNIDEALSVIK